MKPSNSFSRDTIENDEKENLTVLIEDSGSGFSFYSDIIKFFLSDYFEIKFLSCNGFGGLIKRLKSDRSINSDRLLIIFDNVLSFRYKLSIYKQLIKFIKLHVNSKIYYFTPLCLEEVLLSLTSKNSKDQFSIWLESNGSLSNKLFNDDNFEFEGGKFIFKSGNFVIKKSSIEKIISASCENNPELSKIYSKGNLKKSGLELIGGEDTTDIINEFLRLIYMINHEIYTLTNTRLSGCVSNQ